MCRLLFAHSSNSVLTLLKLLEYTNDSLKRARYSDRRPLSPSCVLQRPCLGLASRALCDALCEQYERPIEHLWSPDETARENGTVMFDERFHHDGHTAILLSLWHR